MKRFRSFLISSLLLTAIFQASVYANVEESEQFTYGKVTNVTEKEITIEEYDEDTEIAKEVTYQLASQVDTNSLKVGQSIDIDFTVKDNKKTVTSFEVFEDV